MLDRCPATKLQSQSKMLFEKQHSCTAEVIRTRSKDTHSKLTASCFVLHTRRPLVYAVFLLSTRLFLTISCSYRMNKKKISRKPPGIQESYIKGSFTTICNAPVVYKQIIGPRQDEQQESICLFKYVKIRTKYRTVFGNTNVGAYRNTDKAIRGPLLLFLPQLRGCT